jgi:hypothetical protein
MNCVGEQTDMTISFDSKSFVTYRSICFEGNNPSSIISSESFQEYLNSVKSYCKENGFDDQIQPTGYPEFLYKLYSSLNQSPTQ